MAKNLNMKFYTKLNSDPNFSPTQDIPNNRPKKIDFCYQLWHSPTINYNGNMLGCCVLFDEKYNYGNVFKNGFFHAYNSKKMRIARKMILKKIKNNNLVYCSKCSSKNETKNLSNNSSL